MNNLSTSMNNFHRTEWRRSRVLELSSQGYNQSGISRILQISQPTISRDLPYLEEQARKNIRNHIDKKLPFEYDKCIVALNSLQRKAWEISENPQTEEKIKVQALSLARDCVINKMELLTNATVVDDAIRFVSEHTANNNKEKLISSKEKDSYRQESKEQQPEYSNKDSELKEEQEKETGEITTTETTVTTNQVF